MFHPQLKLFCLLSSSAAQFRAATEEPHEVLETQAPSRTTMEALWVLLVPELIPGIAPGPNLLRKKQPRDPKTHQHLEEQRQQLAVGHEGAVQDAQVEPAPQAPEDFDQHLLVVARFLHARHLWGGQGRSAQDPST